MLHLLFSGGNSQHRIILSAPVHFHFHSVFQVFHKIITSGHQRLQPLFDCLLTIIVNGKVPE